MPVYRTPQGLHMNHGIVDKWSCSACYSIFLWEETLNRTWILAWSERYVFIYYISLHITCSLCPKDWLQGVSLTFKEGCGNLYTASQDWVNHRFGSAPLLSIDKCELTLICQRICKCPPLWDYGARFVVSYYYFHSPLFVEVGMSNKLYLGRKILNWSEGALNVYTGFDIFPDLHIHQVFNTSPSGKIYLLRMTHNESHSAIIVWPHNGQV